MTPIEGRTLKIGDCAEAIGTITDENVRYFAEATGDTNPIHIDDPYAAQTRFGRRISHGLLVSGFISAVLGTKLPGPGAIYLSQTLQFRGPVFIGDAIKSTVEIIDVRADKPIVTLRTTCSKLSGEVVIEGEAILLVPDLRRAQPVRMLAGSLEE
jgi:3-hydroxybutyryl-CoA dehydratase